MKDNPKIILKSSLFQPNNHAGPSPVVLGPCVSYTQLKSAGTCESQVPAFFARQFIECIMLSW